MEDQPKTEYEDRLNKLRKMEYALKDENPTKSPAMTASGQMFAELREIECKLAYTKLSFLEAQDDMKEQSAPLSQSEIKKGHADLTRLLQTSTEIEETLNVKRVQWKAAIQKDKEAHLEKFAKLRALEVKIRSLESEMICLDTFPTEPRPKEQGTPSETPEGAEARAKLNDGTSQEETDVKDEMAPEDAETEDDIGQEALFAQIDAQMALIRAQTKSLGTYLELKAMNDAFLEGVDGRKVQRQRAAQEKVEEMS